MRDFFAARTDIRRLKSAEVVAETILERNDLHDLVEVRSIVAKQELRRQIAYGKQRDHTGHTVYLYLLGIWFYDNIPGVRRSIGLWSPKTDPIAQVNSFLLQWVYASLLHDIGYVFENLTDETRKDRRDIDAMYSLEWLYDQLEDYSVARKDIRDAHHRFTTKFGTPGGIEACGPEDCEVVMDKLAAVPWIGDLNRGLRGFKNSFQVFDPEHAQASSTPLQRYARRVARQGYNGEAVVDHGVASGLLLFQYASYFYWLMQDPGLKKAIMKDPKWKWTYYPSTLPTISRACRAASYHNVRPDVWGAKSIIRGFTLRKNPILFLSILCDELQRWDRFPVGSEHLDDWEKYAADALESHDISISAQGTGQDTYALFEVKKEGFTGKGLYRDLEERVVERWRVVRLGAIDSRVRHEELLEEIDAFYGPSPSEVAGTLRR